MKKMISCHKQIDAVITNYTVCRYQQTHNDHQFESVLVEPLPIVVMLKRGNEKLQHKLNLALDALWKNKELYQIKQKYLLPIGIQPAYSN